MIREHAEPLEADLAHHYHIDLADHWRRDERGRRLLTLRRLAVLVTHLPNDSALSKAFDPNHVWRVADILLAHIWQAVAHSKTTHPMLTAEFRRVSSVTPWTPDRARAVAEARRRAAQRRQAIADGTIT